ncbi:MAG: cyanophycin synthetase [Gammaproteobacteria bacterium]
MQVISTNVYGGPNIYANFPVIRHVVDLGPLEEWPTRRLGDGFIDRLVEALPGLGEHTCSYDTAGGFLRRMREDEGTWMGHVLEHVILELQTIAGFHVSFGRTRSVPDQPGHYTVVFQYKDAEMAREASRLGIDLLSFLLPAELRPDGAPADDWDFSEQRDQFIRYAQNRALGPSTGALVDAAEERGVPWIRLNRYSLVQFGHGKYQRRIQATTTGNTSNIAVDLASDKEETNALLRDLGLPVPEQRLVYKAADAVTAAERIGYPVVIKPLRGNHGRGVSIGVGTAEDVVVAFEKASEHGRAIVVEQYVSGFDHRLLVIDGELIAAAKRVPGHIIGDGKQSVEQLVDQVNRDPRRGVGHEKVLTRLELDHQALRLLSQRGYEPATVPPAGEVVYLRSTGNLSTGGTAIDVTDVIHPDNRDMAIRAIKGIGLDIGGVDFLTADISKSYRETGGGICEVNAGPGFRMHVAPSEGTPRDVAGPVLDMLFPPGSPSTVPIAAVTGTNGKTTTSRMLAHIMKMAGYTVGLASSDGVYIDGNLTVEGDMTGPRSAQMILRDPTIDAAVMETARGGLLRSGLGFLQCDVAACINVSSDHLGLKGINTLEELALVKRIPIEVAQDTAVLNADNTYCLRMASHTEARTVCYVTMNPDHTLVKEHVRAGGRAVVLEKAFNGDMITIYDAGSHIPLLWTHLIPATLEGRAMHNVQNAMFAAGLGFSLGISLENVRQGLRTFDTTFFQAPGRMNIFNELPFKVILDYAHNPAAVKTMCDLVDRLSEAGRKILVLAAPGDRRDEDIREIARAAAGHFDRYICRQDDSLRGRSEGEVPAKLRAGLIEAGVEDQQIEIVPDEQAAVQTALASAGPGDLVMVFGDAIKRCWKQIIYFKPGDTTPAPVRAETARSNFKPLELAGEAFTPSGGVTLLRDERGVMIAPEPEDSD